MNKLLIIAGALVAATPAAAQTAPATTDGAYIGGFVGYSATSPHYGEVGYSTADDFALNPSLEGIAGGFLVGYNRSMGGLKTGLEADWGLLDNEKAYQPNNPFNDYTAFNTKWNAHVRAKLGVELQGATLYGAAGLAVVRMVTDDTDDGYNSFSHTYTGLTLGAGAEKSIGGNAFVRAEYLHDAFGKTNGEITDTSGDSYDIKMKPNTDTVRIGLGLRF